MSTRSWRILQVVVLASCVSAGCGQVDAPGTSEGPPAAAPAASTASTASPGSTAPAGPEPQTVADIFPPGPQREPVLNSCGSCHNVACAAIGQRSAERWEALKVDHKDKVSGANLNAMFAYLNANFGASTPEPRVPRRFLEGGCTPF